MHNPQFFRNCRYSHLIHGTFPLNPGIPARIAWGAVLLCKCAPNPGIPARIAWGALLLCKCAIDPGTPARIAWGAVLLCKCAINPGIPARIAWGAVLLCKCATNLGIPARNAWGALHVRVYACARPRNSRRIAWGALCAFHHTAVVRRHLTTAKKFTFNNVFISLINSRTWNLLCTWGRKIPKPGLPIFTLLSHRQERVNIWGGGCLMCANYPSHFPTRV